MNESQLIAQHQLFIRQLIALRAAGVPIEPSVGENLEKWANQVSCAETKGAPSANLGLISHSFTASYEAAFELWMSGKRTEALDRLTLVLEMRRFRVKRIFHIVFQVLMVFGSVYLGLIFVCKYLLPLFESLHASSFRGYGISLTLLVWLNSTLPIWSLALPLLVGFFIVSFYRSYKRKQVLSPWDLSKALAVFQGIHNRAGYNSSLAIAGVLMSGAAVLFLAYTIFGTMIEILLIAFGD